MAELHSVLIEQSTTILDSNELLTAEASMLEASYGSLEERVEMNKHCLIRAIRRLPDLIETLALEHVPVDSRGLHSQNEPFH